MRGVPLLAVFLLGILTCGSLGDPFLPDEVPFSRVERNHFDALGVVVQRAAASDAPLVVRVHVVGDASDADIAQAIDWLREHANVHVVRDPHGAPLFLTRGDLAATSGRGTLGATVPEGMAVEVRDNRVYPCVVAHEILHFVGLKHVNDRENIMYKHCSRDFLERAQIDDAQLDQLSQVSGIRATTPGGVRDWVSRSTS